MPQCSELSAVAVTHLKIRHLSQVVLQRQGWKDFRDEQAVRLVENVYCVKCLNYGLDLKLEVIPQSSLCIIVFLTKFLCICKVLKSPIHH